MTGTVGLAEQLVSELVDSGATAVALTGSYARGDPTTNSDLDLMIVGEGQSNLTVRVGVLVAQSWASEDEYRGRFLDPSEVGSAVPGWRQALLLHDPEGRAGLLKQEAIRWSWELLDDRCDGWVAERVVAMRRRCRSSSMHLTTGGR